MPHILYLKHRKFILLVFYSYPLTSRICFDCTFFNLHSARLHKQITFAASPLHIALFIRLKVLEVGLWLCNRLLQLVVLRALFRKTVFAFFWEVHPQIDFSCCKKCSAAKIYFLNPTASGVHSAFLQQASPSTFMWFDQTVLNLHSEWFHKQTKCSARNS